MTENFEILLMCHNFSIHFTLHRQSERKSPSFSLLACKFCNRDHLRKKANLHLKVRQHKNKRQAKVKQLFYVIHKTA